MLVDMSTLSVDTCSSLVDMKNFVFCIFLYWSTLAVHWSTWVKFYVLYFPVLVDMRSLSVDMKMCQKHISRHEQSIGWYELFSVLYFLCQSTWAVRWSTWRLIKICFLFFCLLFYFKHVFNKCTHLKHFKHIIKYNMSSLNVLESSKSSRVNNFLLFDDNKILELAINNLHMLFIIWVSN